MSGWRAVAQIQPEHDGPSILQAPDGTIYLSDGVQSFPLGEADLRRLRKMLMTAAGAPVAHGRNEGRLP
jgi:hypothetical protein